MNFRAIAVALVVVSAVVLFAWGTVSVSRWMEGIDSATHERWRAAGWEKHQSGPFTGQWYCAREVCDI